MESVLIVMLLGVTTLNSNQSHLMINLTVSSIHDLDLHLLFPFNLDIYRHQVINTHFSMGSQR